jgi:SNF2 family DNA or RNA helicase
MLRRLKSQVLSNLPPKRRRRVPVELEAIDRQTYDKAEKNVVAWLNSLGEIERARSAKQTIFVKLLFLRRIAALGKLRRALPSYLESWFSRTRRPLVIFGYHRDVLKITRKMCLRMGLSIAQIHGKDPPEKRQQAIDSFSSGNVQVFLAPILAAGVGVNLQHGGSDALFLERHWVPTTMNQAEDRIHRIGQTKAVTITYLDAKNTIDEKIARMLQLKQRIIDAVVDDAKRPDDEAMEEEALEHLVSGLRGPGR